MLLLYQTHTSLANYHPQTLFSTNTLRDIVQYNNLQLGKFWRRAANAKIRMHKLSRECQDQKNITVRLAMIQNIQRTQDHFQHQENVDVLHSVEQRPFSGINRFVQVLQGYCEALTTSLLFGRNEKQHLTNSEPQRPITRDFSNLTNLITQVGSINYSNNSSGWFPTNNY